MYLTLDKKVVQGRGTCVPGRGTQVPGRGTLVPRPGTEKTARV